MTGKVTSLDLSFFADYVLSEEGPHNVPRNILVHLLLVHPWVCLVLRYGGPSRPHILLTTYRQIGIVRLPSALIDEYIIDWVAASTLTQTRIV
jgi:hypothetical protein